MAKSFNARMKERFAQITASYDAANALVHETAMEIIRHTVEHGDCSTAQGLVLAMPKSTRREMLILWFNTYTPIVVKNDDNWKAALQPETLKNGKPNPLYKPFDVESAEADPFYRVAERNKEAAPALDAEGILKLISRLAAQLDKKVKDGEVEASVEDSVISAAAQLRRIRVTPKAPANDAGEGAATPKKAANA